jgi:hypothetical protein
MADLSGRSTIYFDPDLHRALRIKAAVTPLYTGLWIIPE